MDRRDHYKVQRILRSVKVKANLISRIDPHRSTDKIKADQIFINL